MPFAATWMDLGSAILSEVSQRRRNIVWHPLHVESKKKWYKWTHKTETDSQTPRTSLRLLLGVGGGEEWGKGIVREFGMDMYTQLYLKRITSKDLLNTTWNSATLLSGSLDGRGTLRENGYMCVYIYGWVPLLFIWNSDNTVC